MTRRFGIDTSILVRLATGDPEVDYLKNLAALTRLVEQEQVEILVSNQVIGEAYMALQFHYGAAKSDARTALATVLQSGLVAAQNGAKVIEVLLSEYPAGLLDRLIAEDYQREGFETLTNDKRMAKLPGCSKL